jgi:hypothetical protein
MNLISKHFFLFVLLIFELCRIKEGEKNKNKVEKEKRKTE